MPGQLVIFPDQFLPIREWNQEELRKYPFLIGGFIQDFSQEEFQEAIIQIMEKRLRSSGSKYSIPRGECRFKIIPFVFPEGVFYLALEPALRLDLEDDFLVFDPPIQSRSQRQGSQALYYAAHKKDGLLLQYLPSNSQTSSHNHEHVGWTENYYLLAGEAQLRTCQGNYPLTKINPSCPTIRPEVIHQVVTGEQPSLILIEIKGDHNWFDKWLTGQGHCFKDLG